MSTADQCMRKLWTNLFKLMRSDSNLQCRDSSVLYACMLPKKPELISRILACMSFLEAQIRSCTKLCIVQVMLLHPALKPFAVDKAMSCCLDDVGSEEWWAPICSSVQMPWCRPGKLRVSLLMFIQLTASDCKMTTHGSLSTCITQALIIASFSGQHLYLDGSKLIDCRCC